MGSQTDMNRAFLQIRENPFISHFRVNTSDSPFISDSSECNECQQPKIEKRTAPMFIPLSMSVLLALFLLLKCKC